MLCFLNQAGILRFFACFKNGQDNNISPSYARSSCMRVHMQAQSELFFTLRCGYYVHVYSSILLQLTTLAHASAHCCIYPLLRMCGLGNKWEGQGKVHVVAYAVDYNDI